jgi:hypothetical protein
VLTRFLEWYRRRRLVGLAMLGPGIFLVGWHVAASVGQTPSTAQTRTRTLHRTSTIRQTRYVTVHVHGKVIRRYDHVLVVYVPRVVFHTHTTPRRRIVVPAHVVRVVHRPATPTSPPFALVQGVSPPPITVTFPVTVTVPVTETGPGPTTTLTQLLTETQPASTVTSTITIPLGDTGGNP